MLKLTMLPDGGCSLDYEADLVLDAKIRICRIPSVDFK